MHRTARNIFFGLGLTSLLSDVKIFFPERTRHLYQILVALDLKIEQCNEHLGTINPHLLSYYEVISKYFYLLLDSTAHENISDELADELTNGFVTAVTKAAHEGKPGVLHRQHALSIFLYLELGDLVPQFSHKFPEKTNAHGFLILAGERKEDKAA